jgi:hypothetical protein
VIRLVREAQCTADRALEREGEAAPRREARPTLFVHLSMSDHRPTGDHMSPVEETASQHAPADVDSRADGRRWHGELHDGTPIDGATLLRLACDTGLVMAKTDGPGGVLDLGRKKRTVSPSLLRALQIRDRTCRFPGCTHRAFLDAHHIEHWAHGGETTIGNTVLLCHAHHVAVHEGGVTVATRPNLDGGATILFRDPDGRAIPDTPSMRCHDPDPIEALERDQTARSIVIEPLTAIPRLRSILRPDLNGCVRALARRTSIPVTPT